MTKASQKRSTATKATKLQFDSYASEKVAAFRKQVAASIRSHAYSLPDNVSSNPKELLFLISDLIAEGKMP